MNSNPGQPQAQLLLYRGISFERRGDLYAALDCYREGLTQASVGSDIHQELSQILSSLQGRLAQPGARGPHYDGGAMGDPETESHEVRKCHQLFRTAYGRQDWKTAEQTLELAVKYRPFFVIEQRSVWKQLEEVRIRGNMPEVAKAGMPIWGWALIAVAVGTAGIGVYRGSSTASVVQTPTPTSSTGRQVQFLRTATPVSPPVATPTADPLPGNTTAGPSKARVILNLPKVVPIGKELKLISQAIGPESTLQLTWTADRGAIVNLNNETWWKPPPDGKAGDIVHLKVQGRDASGALTAPMQHAMMLGPAGQ